MAEEENETNNGNGKEKEIEEEAEMHEDERREKGQIGKEKGVIGAEIVEEMEKAYIDYAMSVIVQRALPSVEDGLKPVHRRILYAMDAIGLDSSKATRKCAAIVGEVLGKYHPHGDMAVYDALVRLAQDFSLRYPLIHGQGNFGCFTEDTKVKLTDGRDLSFSDLIAEHNNGKKNFTFTIDDNGIINIAEIKNPRLTRKDAEIIKVVLDNGEEIRCTPNHKFMLRNGEYREANDIKSGDSLMPSYIKLSTDLDSPEKPKTVGYTMIFQPKINSWDFVHILADKWNISNGIYEKSAGKVRHHINFNKLDNNPNNIQRMNWKEHWKTHYDFTSDKHKTDTAYVKSLAEGREKFWANKKNREAYSQRLSERNKQNWKNRVYREKMTLTLSQVNKRYFAEHPDIIEEIRKRASITMKKMWSIPKYKELFHEKIVASNKKRETNLTGKRKFVTICSYLKKNNLAINRENYEEVRNKSSDWKHHTTWDSAIKKYYHNEPNLVLQELNGNHKVVSVQRLNEFADVYDLTIDKTHNFALASGIFVHNSLDGDNAAAPRYTEAKLSKISQELLKDIEKETVKMRPNFDNTHKEPATLPGKLPNLFLNGATGIAVGMATNIPPHNLNEVCDAIVEYIKKPNVTSEELAEIVKGPDFPTGGYALGSGVKEVYTKGKGKIVMRARTTTEDIKGREHIIITEIPYMVNKSDLIKEIAKLAGEKKLPDVSDLRDESAKGKVRIVIELRKGVDSQYTLNKLYKLTRCQTNFDANMLALVDNKPKILTIKDYVTEYVKYRKIVIKNRSKFDLRKAEERMEIVIGLILALKDIDRIVEFIKKSKNAQEAHEGLVHKFKFTSNQAKAILETKLQQLTSLEQGKLKDEEKELKETIEYLTRVLGSEEEVLRLIKKDLEELKKNYGDERKTRVMKKLDEISEEDLVEKKDVVVLITNSGYIKRMDVKTYREQRRGGSGVTGADLKDEDFVKDLITCSTHDQILFFTSRGRVFWLKAHEIPAAERQSKGRALANVLNLRDEALASVMALSDEDNSEGNYLMFVTKQGIVKKLAVKDLGKPRATGVRIMNLPVDNSDTLIDVQRLKDKQEVLLITSKGQAIRFNSDNVRTMGRASYGVKGVELGKSDYVVSLEVLPLKEDNTTILTITEKGYGKRSALEDYRKTSRGGKGVINLKTSSKTGDIVKSLSVIDKDSIIATTTKGMVIRTGMKDLRVMGRATQGVHVVKLKEGDKVSDVVKVPKEDDIPKIGQTTIEENAK